MKRADNPKHAFKDHSPRGEKRCVQRYSRILWVVIVLLIQTEHEGLNHQVSKSVRSCSKHIGDAGVNGFIVSWVGGQLTGNEVWANNVEQVVSESEDLVDGEHHSHQWMKRISLTSTLNSSTHLEVSSHNFSSLLVDPLPVPLRVNSSQSSSQTVVFSHHQSVQRSQGDVLIGSLVT